MAMMSPYLKTKLSLYGLSKGGWVVGGKGYQQKPHPGQLALVNRPYSCYHTKIKLSFSVLILLIIAPWHCMQEFLVSIPRRTSRFSDHFSVVVVVVLVL